jgi:hypothetical protein
MTDPNAIKLSITALLGSLGAAIAVTYYFLAFLRDAAERQARLVEDFKDYHRDSQKMFQDQLDRLSDRSEQLYRQLRAGANSPSNDSPARLVDRAEMTALSIRSDAVLIFNNARFIIEDDGENLNEASRRRLDLISSRASSIAAVVQRDSQKR